MFAFLLSPVHMIKEQEINALEKLELHDKESYNRSRLTSVSSFPRHSVGAPSPSSRGGDGDGAAGAARAGVEGLVDEDVAVAAAEAAAIRALEDGGVARSGERLGAGEAAGGGGRRR